METDNTSSSDSTYSEPSEREFSDYASTDISEPLRELIMSHQLEAENSILRHANTRLRHNMELLRQRLRWQAIEHERELSLIETIDDLRTPRPTWKPLPTEVLHSIMLFTVPPDYLLHHSSQQAFYTPWCKVMDMKLSLISVSKAWYHAALPLLYEDVVFHHVGPIAAFLETLRGTIDTVTSNKFATMVRSVHVSCLVPPGLDDFLKNSLNEIRNVCPRISVLGFSTLDHSVSLDPLSSVPLTELYLGPPGVRQWHERKPIDASHASRYISLLSHVSATLQSLEIHLWGWGSGDDPFPQLSFPSLKNFKLNAHCTEYGQGPPHMEPIIMKWQFPVLERFAYPGGLNHWVPGVDDFLTRHGSHLKYLDIDIYYFQTPVADNPAPDGCNRKLQSVLDACPLLEHLVISELIPNHVILRHPCLKYIDSYGTFETGIHWERHPPRWGRGLLVVSELVKDEDSGYMQSALPNLVGIRFVDNLLYPLCNLLVHLKPLPANESPYTIDLHGMTLRHEVGLLYAINNGEEVDDNVYVDEHFPSYYLESDEESLVNVDYLNDEEESDVSFDSDEVHNDREVLEAYEEDEVPEEGQADDQIVLEMYRQTLA